jgi:SSS family solute:Na+ symporter
MVGIILAAMLSATMASVSADFNAIASVLTEDVYHRLIRSDVSSSHLLRVGRLLTLALGTLTTALSLWIAFSHREALFSLMVTVFGIFMAPTMLPLLVGLTVPRATARGVFFGFLCGFSSGLIMLALKTFWPPASTIFGSSYGFEGVSLITNTIITLLGILLGSLLWKREAAEEISARRFFSTLARPIHTDPATSPTSSSSTPVLALSTLGVALLIGVASAVSRSHTATLLDAAAACLFFILSAAMYLRRPAAAASK